MIEQILDSNTIVLFTRRGGPVSQSSKDLLSQYGLNFFIQEVEDDKLMYELEQISGWHLLPQLFVRREFIGGGLVIAEFVESGEMGRILGREIQHKGNKIKTQSIWRISLGNNSVFTASANGKINLYDTNLNFVKNIYEGERWVNSVKVSTNKKIVAAGFSDASINIWKNDEPGFLKLKAHRRKKKMNNKI